MPTASRFRIDVTINDLLTSSPEQPGPAAVKGLKLPAPVFLLRRLGASYG
jgi:hypothetical protein